MGNDQSCSDNHTLMRTPLKTKQAQLTDTQSYQQSVYEQRQEEFNCCGFIKYKKIVLKKVDWKSKFIRNCEEIEEEFQWAKELAFIVENWDMKRGKQFKEIDNLKKEKYMPRLSESEKKPTEKEIETFKKNLKKSVIMSFGPNSKSFDNVRMSAINVKKSRLEVQRNSRVNANKSDIMVERALSGLSSKDKAKKSFIEFMDEDELTKEGNHDISKETTHQLQVFMKFSSKLEIHLSDVSFILGNIKSEYIKIMIKKYGGAAKESVQLNDFVDDVTQFLIILKLAVMDYYNLPSFAEKSINFLISNEENILSTCTSILFKDHQFYNLLFNTISNHFRESEEKFMKILDALQGSGPERFTVKDKFCLNHRTLKAYLNQMSAESGENIVQNVQILDQMDNEEPFKRCMDYLKEIVKSRSPINKMKSIVACSQGVTKEIEAFYQRNGLKKQKWMLDADQVLSILVYIIVSARVQHMHTQLFILDSFATGHQAINMTGYYTAVLNCAVEHLQHEFQHLINKPAKSLDNLSS